MRYYKSVGRLLAGVVMVSAWTVLAGGNKDDLTITAATSQSGIVPTSPGNSPKNHVYAYCLPSGSSLSDSLPISFRLDNTNGSSGESAEIEFNVTGIPSLVAAVTPPVDFFVTDNSVTHAKSVVINSGVLADGAYNVNVHISADPANKVDLTHDKIQITVVVGAVCGGGQPTCLLTDSQFNNLYDCDGDAVTSNTGGTFEIIKNPKNRLVATNPGQFYYSVFWTNTSGSPVTVEVTLASNNLLPKGANSAHIWTFAPGYSQDTASFDVVNDGVPCGQGGPCTISVPAGHTVWTTWHLEYSKIGLFSPPVSLSNICTTPTLDGTVWARGTIVNVTNPTSPTPIGPACQATATGTLK